MNVQERVSWEMEDVQGGRKFVRFSDVVEVLHFESAPKCLMLIQGKYVDLVGDEDDRRLCRMARLTGCTTRLNMTTTRRNKYGEMCFIVTVEGNTHSDLERLKKLVRSKLPDILFPSA